MSRADAERWGRGLDTVMERIGARFGRVGPRRRALAYLRGLRRRWSARTAGSWPRRGDATPDGMQDSSPDALGRGSGAR